MLCQRLTEPHGTPNRSPRLAPLGGCSKGAPGRARSPSYNAHYMWYARTPMVIRGPCANHIYWPAEPYLSPAAAEASSRGWPPRAVAARARSSYAVTSAVELSGVVTVDTTCIVATPALEGV